VSAMAAIACPKFIPTRPTKVVRDTQFSSRFVRGRWFATEVLSYRTMNVRSDNTSSNAVLAGPQCRWTRAASAGDGLADCGAGRGRGQR
jgi:hypothetical protein